MIFRPEEIGDGGLFFEVSKSGEWLTNIREIAENKGETKLLSDVFFAANIEKMDGHLSVSGSLSFDLLSPCARCLKPARGKVSRQIAFFLPLKSRREKIVDISDDMREQVAMAMPERQMCSGGCKGLCPLCGTDLNENVCGCKTEKTDERFEVLKQLGPS